MTFVAAATEAYRQSYIEALEEGFRLGGYPMITPEEVARARRDPAPFFRDVADPPPLVALPNGETVVRPPATLLWWVDEKEFIGAVEIRHSLPSAVLAAYAGHMSVGVRPSRQRQGHFSRMRVEALKIAEGLGIERLLATCRADNVGARRVIEASGAIFMDEVPIPYSATPATLRRYINVLGAG